MTLDWFNIAALLGATQGFFLTGVLATQRRNRIANRLLAVAVFVFSIQMISVVYHAVEFEQVFPHFFGAAYPMAFLYGPLIYLYSVGASDRARRLRKWDAVHFLPFALVVLAGLPIYLMSGTEKIEFYHQLQLGIRPPWVIVADTLKYVSGICYTFATISFLRRHRVQVMDSYSSTERVNLKWLLHLASAGAVIWLVASLFHVGELLSLPISRSQDDVVALAIAVLVYGIGYRALRQPEVFNVATGEFPTISGHEPPLQISTQEDCSTATARPTLEDPPRYERSGLRNTEAALLKDALLSAMENDRPYNNCDLTLPDLSEKLDTTPHKLSEVLNSQLSQNFYDFVNGYRVREVQQRLADGKSQALTLLSLALDAGFASKSTFNSVFKKLTGQTPSAYRRSLESKKGSTASLG
jgi:AraC-like DNA-binding protein